ncbi:apolipoprotein N-acyltransferase [Methylomonas koyamae]|uniref:Apolipoprotein N-acyltransferase n=1 Tax=Methylomonas koyamae TaxID=702114 RepID=A0A291IJN9_9GAMM|nr:apolipoprotein N-acyltransferase [Methylomonas koyamae]ATG90408.1 Apolipoprotein N-acyltransferase [Methylomonas koyamae]OAI24625.1 apolipoprotein N-acyltransferase [Methylomonas koyamae]
MKQAFRSPWWLPVLSGIFIGTSYIPFPPWASLFCFVPLWRFWQGQQRLRPVLLGGVLTSFIYTLIGFNWVTYTLHEFANVNWLVAGIGMLIFAAFGHLFLPIAGLAWFYARRILGIGRGISLALMAAITALAEFYVPMLFKWNFGYSWYGAGLPLYQWAEIVGFAGLSMLTVLTNLAALYAWDNRRQRGGKAAALAIVLGFAGLNAGGSWLKQRLPVADSALDVLLVQANIGNLQKQSMERGKGYRAEILTQYFQATDAGLAEKPDVDFVMWSETAFPALLGGEYNQSQYAELLQTFVRNRQLALLTGAYAKDQHDAITNSLFVVDETGKVTEPHYSKTILLALGEYIPFADVLPWLKTALPMVSQFGRGPGPTLLLHLNGFDMGPQVCYESLFPEFSKGLADLGAQFIVNVTNDSWYGTWQEPYQHLYMTLARGVEFRRPVLRATNTGISTVALADGKVLPLSPVNKSWAGSYHVPFLKQPASTFYQRHFYLMPGLLWGGLIVLTMAGLWERAGKSGVSAGET